MSDQEAYSKAKKRVDAKMGFYIHMSIYLGVCIILTIINLAITGEYFWAKWPIMGWGVGVTLHALFTFVFIGKSTLKEKMIRKEMQKGDVQ